MERRSFLHATIAATCAAGAGAAGAAEEKKVREIYEWRVYTLKAAKQPTLDAYFSKAFIPTLKRLNEGPVGVFVEKLDASETKLHVLIVHPSGEAFATLSSRLAADADYIKLGRIDWASPATRPTRVSKRPSWWRSTACRNSRRRTPPSPGC